MSDFWARTLLVIFVVFGVITLFAYGMAIYIGLQERSACEGNGGIYVDSRCIPSSPDSETTS